MQLCVTLWWVRNKKKRDQLKTDSLSCERKTRLELATLTLARLCSTNWAISAFLHSRVVFSFADAKVDLFFESPKLFGVFFRNVCGSSFPMGVEGWSGRGLCGWFSVGYFHEESRQGGAGSLSDFYTPMHEVTPKVVAMAVSTVITMFRILLQMFLFSIFLKGEWWKVKGERLKVKG